MYYVFKDESIVYYGMCGFEDVAENDNYVNVYKVVNIIIIINISIVLLQINFFFSVSRFNSSFLVYTKN